MDNKGRTHCKLSLGELLIGRDGLLRRVPLKQISAAECYLALDVLIIELGKVLFDLLSGQWVAKARIISRS